MMKSAIYPGSFDPLTKGHLDIIERALKTFDHLIVAVAHNPDKKPFFSIEQRMELIKKCMPSTHRLEIDSFSGLLVDYARQKQVFTLLRGLRAVSDFEYEFQMAMMNQKLAPDMETIFMMTGEANFYVSSKLVREVAALGGNVTALVPPAVFEALQKKFKKTSTPQEES